MTAKKRFSPVEYKNTSQDDRRTQDSPEVFSSQRQTKKRRITDSEESLSIDPSSQLVDEVGPIYLDDQKNGITEYGPIFLYDKVFSDASLSDQNLVSSYKCDVQLVGHNEFLPLTPLYSETPEIRGGASLEAENLFIAGKFIIPAMKKKNVENCGDNCLIVIVLRCEARKVKLTINSNAYELSRTDVFWVPKQNDYALSNESQKQDAEFIFINVRSDYSFDCVNKHCMSFTVKKQVTCCL